jgi:hypothetical protein
MKDYRLLENRREAFIKWYHWSIHFDDCDPAIFMTNYLFDRFEHNQEQKLWIAWIYGTTYHFPTAWIIWNEFPDFELVDQERLEEWNSKNYKRLRYQTDTKYNKGHLPAQYASYRDWVFKNGKSQREAFNSFLWKPDCIDAPYENFANLYDELSNNLHKFGRYTTWFYLQTLKHCCGIPIQPTTLLLSDYSGSRSHRNGLCLALGKDDWIDKKLTPEEYRWMEDQAIEIQIEVAKRVYATRPDRLHFVDKFSMETALCSFKKIFRVKRGRYLGYYLDRQAEEISQVEKDGWDGIFWKPLWDSRTEHPIIAQHPELLLGRIQDERMSQFVDIGSIERLHFLYGEDAPRLSLESFWS